MTLALIATTVSAAVAQDLGFVLEASGKWQVASGTEAARPLVAGQGIKAGDKLLPGAPDAKLTVVMLDGTRLACPSDPRCAAPLGAKAADKPGLARRMLRAIGGLFSQPERYAATMSRGEELRESVAVIRKGRLDLTDTLKALPVGTWHVTLHEIDGQGVVIGESFSVDVDTSAKGVTAMPQVNPPRLGLYRASLESGADAWVILVPVADEAKVRSLFGEAQEVARGFGKDVSARATRSFLRAALDGIATGKVK